MAKDQTEAEVRAELDKPLLPGSWLTYSDGTARTLIARIDELTAERVIAVDMRDRATIRAEKAEAERDLERETCIKQIGYRDRAKAEVIRLKLLIENNIVESAVLAERQKLVLRLREGIKFLCPEGWKTVEELEAWLMDDDEGPGLNPGDLTGATDVKEGCLRCGKPRLPMQIYCGAACSVKAEAEAE